jgi:prepilin-type N-terminal cleavage/methylation domain-containing protein
MTDTTGRSPDQGYTLIEMLMVVVILGVLGSVVAISLHGMSTEAAGTGCKADDHQLSVAAESFFAQTGADQIPETGAGHDRFEATLVAEGFLRAPSTFHDLDANGVVTPEEHSSC